MKKLSKILKKTSDYFTGIGSGNYTETINFYNQYYEGKEKLTKIISSKGDQISKISIRASLTMLESVLIYKSIKYDYLSPLITIIPSELFRWSSIYFDRKSIKRVRKEKAEATHQDLDEIAEAYNQRKEQPRIPEDIEGEEWKKE